jgi:predicted LPLAT superfamily acyltransferase
VQDPGNIGADRAGTMPRHVDSGLDRAADPEWVARPERSNIAALRFMAWVAMALGRPAARLLLYPICCYFLLFSGRARSASSGYLRRVLGRKPGLVDSFRHYHTFAATILDRVFLLHDQFSRFDVRVHGAGIIEESLEQGQGCVLLGAHMGSFEIVRAVGRQAIGPKLSIAMYEANARKVGSVIEALNPDLHKQVIALGHVDSILKVEAVLARGEVLGMLADRALTGEGTVVRHFLGEPARFPVGPFRMAAILNRPVVLMFGIYRGGNRYDVHLERLVDMTQAERPQRDRVVEESLRRYVARLEHYCRIAPYNWFNFYDYWR